MLKQKIWILPLKFCTLQRIIDREEVALASQLPDLEEVILRFKLVFHDVHVLQRNCFAIERFCEYVGVQALLDQICRPVLVIAKVDLFLQRPRVDLDVLEPLLHVLRAILLTFLENDADVHAVD